MKIGVIGLGVVGSAVKQGLENLGHKVVTHDIKYGTTINDVLETEIVFVCVPSPSKSDSSCDTSIIESVIEELDVEFYQGIIAVRSTIEPGFTERMIEKYSGLEICFVPEFLRERCALQDFTQNHQALIVGTHSDHIYNKMIQAHGRYPKTTVMLNPTEAEIVKLYANAFAAMKVVFANIMYELTNSLGGDYNSVKAAFLKTGKIDANYLDVNKSLRGYGGVCLPKDAVALAKLLEKKGFNFELIAAIHNDNEKFETTVFEGMRNVKTDT